MSDGHDFQTIYDALRERISLLDYPPGTLLSENRLAAEFGVSRTPIRRVLHRLEFDGLVTVTRGIGTIVTPVDVRYLAQVYSLRRKLLDLIGEGPAPHVTAADLALLEGILARAESLDPSVSPRTLAELYLRFNEGLTRAIGNRPLREIADRLFHQTSRVWHQLLSELDMGEESGALVSEVQGVLDGLRSRDMEHVARVRRCHFEAMLRRMNRHLVGSELETTTMTREGGESALSS